MLITAIAGETSGDNLAANILYNLQTTTNVEINGIGGDLLQEIGQKQWFNCHDLAVRGYVEVLPNLIKILKIRAYILKQLKQNRPTLYLGIDAADFNLHIEQYAANLKIPVVHFISPSIWAWRAHRIDKIKRAVKHMLCIFPFEPKIYHKHGVNATFVGHPMASQIPLQPQTTTEARKELQLKTKTLTIALLPGSRTSEIKFLGKLFLDVALALQKHYGNIQFVLPIANNHINYQILQLKEHYIALGLNLILTYQSNLALSSSDFALVASGTATLETALHKKPMLIAYKVPWLTAQIMKRQGYLPYVGLPNIIAGKFIVPEFLQDRANVNLLFKSMVKLIERNNQPTIEIFHKIHQVLSKDTIGISAEIIQSFLK